MALDKCLSHNLYYSKKRNISVQVWKTKLQEKMRHKPELKNKTRKTIDDLYMKILDRHVDDTGLVNFGSMLENGKITLEDIKRELKNSKEYMRVFHPVARKKEIRNDTRKTIDDLYMKILGRHADSDGIEFFGSMLESGRAIPSDVRNELLNSFELWDRK